MKTVTPFTRIEPSQRNPLVKTVDEAAAVATFPLVVVSVNGPRETVRDFRPQTIEPQKVEPTPEVETPEAGADPSADVDPKVVTSSAMDNATGSSSDSSETAMVMHPSSQLVPGVDPAPVAKESNQSNEDQTSSGFPLPLV